MHVCVRPWTCIQVPVLALFCKCTLFTRLCAFERASTCLCRPFSENTPCARVCVPLDVHPRACFGLFLCVRRVHIVFRHLVLHLGARNCPFRCVHPVHAPVRLRTCINVPVPALFGVYALFTCLYAYRRASTCQYLSISVCKPCFCVCTPLDVPPRAITVLFLCVHPVYACVRLWTCIHVPQPALSRVSTL